MIIPRYFDHWPQSGLLFTMAGVAVVLAALGIKRFVDWVKR